jgi:uncharacterized membrane protein affecting hemolysin expression
VAGLVGVGCQMQAVSCVYGEDGVQGHLRLSYAQRHTRARTRTLAS